MTQHDPGAAQAPPTPPKRTRRASKGDGIFQRGARWWGDFRQLGGDREPLVPHGASLATTDKRLARMLYSDRCRDLTERQRLGHVLRRDVGVTLGAFAQRHLIEKAKAGKVTRQHLQDTQRHLERACAFWGAEKPLDTLTPTDVRAWLAHLRTLPVQRTQWVKADTRTLSDPACRQHLNSLSNLFRRAMAEGKAIVNPVRALLPEDKPTSATQRPTPFFESHEVAALLAAARAHKPQRADEARWEYPLLATLALTGGRPEEVRGLLTSDVDFVRGVISIAPNAYRRAGLRLKTAKATRLVPLWPQLATILRAYLNAREGAVIAGATRSPLLFPSPDDPNKPIHDPRRAFDAIGQRAGFPAGAVRSRVFRQTYASARMQTLDHGAPISPYTVSNELGHGSLAMVMKHYARLGRLRHRAEVVEYVSYGAVGTMADTEAQAFS